MIPLLLLAAGLALAAPPPPSTWSRAKASRAERPMAPDADRRLALTALVADLLRAAPSGQLPPQAEARASALGLVLERHGEVLWLAEPARVTPVEAEDEVGGEDRSEGDEEDDEVEAAEPDEEAAGQGPALRGDGLVAIRLGALPTELVLQAPHPDYDEHTGRIAGALFDLGGVRAAMVATHPRKAVRGMDPTDATRGPLQAATAAVPLALPDALVVQLHGFAPRRTPADGVLSTGRSRATGALQAQAALALERALDVDDLRGPEQVPRLAALANVQALLLADRVRFLHVELSAATRGRLRRDEALRERLRLALLALAAREPAP